MALSSVEKQRNYRARQREKREAERRATAVMPVPEHEAELGKYKARVADWRTGQIEKRQALEAQIAALEAEVARLEEELSGQAQGKRCRSCGGGLVWGCPSCYDPLDG